MIQKVVTACQRRQSGSIQQERTKTAYFFGDVSQLWNFAVHRGNSEV